MRRSALLAALLLAAAAAVPPRARAATDEGVVVGSRPGLSLGGRGAYFKPKDAADGSWSGGAQVRLHLGSAFAIEGSADVRQDRFGETVVDIVPVQASLLAYLFPGRPVSPYILGGAGWYYTHISDVSPFGDRTDHRFGPHAGAGLQVWFNRHWSIDGSYRYVWLSAYRSRDASHPLGREIRDRGWMATAALNYHLF
ncbi:MAG: porin family protein [Elusimicrobia bacterium]|nr:porin family protein [Elusimicrobiota bacterium]